MPYRKTLECIAEQRDQLDQIIAAEGKIVTFETNEPKRLRYRLHEALDAARYHGVEPYASLQVEVMVKSPYVYVRPKVDHSIKIKAVAIDDQAVGIPAHDIRVHDQAVTEFDVVAAVRENPDIIEHHFPAFAGNMSAVRAYAEAKGYDIVDSSVLALRKQGES